MKKSLVSLAVLATIQRIAGNGVTMANILSDRHAAWQEPIPQAPIPDHGDQWGYIGRYDGVRFIKNAGKPVRWPLADTYTAPPIEREDTGVLPYIVHPVMADAWKAEHGSLPANWLVQERLPKFVDMDMGSPDGDASVRGWWGGQQIVRIEEVVRTGPGTPFVQVPDYSRGYPAESLPEHQAMDETAEWSQQGEKVLHLASRTLGEAFLRREEERAKNRRAADQLAAMATITSPRGSMGEEVASEPYVCGLAAMFGGLHVNPPKDPHCSMEPQCPGALGKGCYLCEPGPFDTYMGAVREVNSWSRTRPPVLTREQDEADRAELDRINAPKGDPYRAKVRLTPFGSEPWDLAAGEAS